MKMISHGLQRDTWMFTDPIHNLLL